MSTRKVHKKHRTAGFTLVELLTVMAIMAILAAMLLPALSAARKKGQIAKCISTIASLQTALAMYQVDYGMYPASATSSAADDQHNGNSHNSTPFDGSPNNLVAALTATTLGGPYMEFKANDLLECAKDSGDTDEEWSHYRYVLRDPWGQAYIYVCEKWHDGSSFQDVDSSRGPFHPNATTDKDKNSYNIYSLGPGKKTYEGEGYTETDWDDSDLYNSQYDGDWKSAPDSEDGRYDDINSWDGSRSFGGT